MNKFLIQFPRDLEEEIKNHLLFDDEYLKTIENAFIIYGFRESKEFKTPRGLENVLVRLSMIIIQMIYYVYSPRKLEKVYHYCDQYRESDSSVDIISFIVKEYRKDKNITPKRYSILPYTHLEFVNDTLDNNEDFSKLLNLVFTKFGFGKTNEYENSKLAVHSNEIASFVAYMKLYEIHEDNVRKARKYIIENFKKPEILKIFEKLVAYSRI